MDVATLNVLAVNVGSSTVKLRVVDDADQVLGRDDIDYGGSDRSDEPDDAAIDDALARLERQTDSLLAVAHRIVHGGPELQQAVRVDEPTLAALDRASTLAPLHNPPAVALLRRLTASRPDLAHVACFDTAFHTTLPEAAWRYALPSEWADDLGVRRYGFHGLNHAYASRRAAARYARPGDELRVVVCHLGAGVSLTAVVDGRSVDTTMGFTPLEGMVMATRSGDVDPGALLWLQDRLHISATELADALNHRSGLLGLSGATGDMRELLERRRSGEPRSALALDVYVHRLRKGVAGMASSAGGLDVLVFTGGVGENAPEIRAEVCTGLRHLGVALDGEANERVIGNEQEISSGDSTVHVLVVAACEEVEMARQARAVLRSRPAAG
jgi:acetate kinase